MANTSSCPTLAQCQHDSVVLSGLLEAISHLENEGNRNAMGAVLAVALAAADKLSNDIDRVERAR